MQYIQKLFSIIILFTLASCSKFEKLRKSGTDEAKYKAAIEYYNLADYTKAGLLFEEVIPIIKGSTEQEMANFYQAYCDYHTGQYQTASFHFKQFAETWARSSYAEEAVYKSAYSLYKDSPDFELDQASSLTATDALQNFVNNYPNSKYREEASNIIKELRVKLETKAFEKAKLYYKTSPSNIAHYKAAVIAITNFQKEFPDSEYLEEMAYLKVASQYYYGFNSFESKKKERYTELVNYYQELVDKFPNSKKLKETEKYFDFGQKELDRIDKAEKAEKAKKEAEKTGKVAGASTTSN
jgi:outer membrane protein assembly factor BamD